MKKTATKTNGGDVLREIPINLVDSGGWNPRTSFDKEKLQELAGDIAANGIIEPLIVRPNKKGRFQIVAGERRFRAAKIAKLKTVPAVVRELEDATAYQQTVSENLNRVDLHPIEEARAFAQIRDFYHALPKEIARRTGKSLPYVVNRLQLTTLDPAVAREAMALSDKLPLGHLQLVSQIGGGEVQHEFLMKIVRPPYNGRSGGILGYDQAKKELEDYQRPLSSAQFDVADGSLTKAPVCGECPQNTTNLPRDVFSRKDLCTNLQCFTAKTKATMVKLSEDGDYTLIKDAKKIFPYAHSGNHVSNEFVNLDEKRYDGSGPERTWRQWFKHGDGELAPQVFVAMSPHTQRIVFLARRNEAEAAVREIKKLDPGVKKSTRRVKSAHEIKQALETKAKNMALGRVSAKVREKVRSFGTFDEYNLALRGLIAGLKHNYQFGEALAKAARSRGIELSEGEKKKSTWEQRPILGAKLIELAGGMTGGELLALALEVIVFEQSNTYDTGPAARVATLFGVDFNAEMKSSLAELAEPKKAKQKPAAAAAAG